METVRKITLTGKSVICSIHQPREKIFKLFDKVLLLTQGKTSFYGPQSKILEFFEAAGEAAARNLTSFENHSNVWLQNVTVVSFQHQEFILFLICVPVCS